MKPLPFSVQQSVRVCARRDTVFSFFSDSARCAAWWGEGSTVEGRVGGRVHIRYPNGATAGGTVLELDPPHRVVFTFGYPEPEKPIAWGASRVTITLTEQPGGTLVNLTHDVDSEAVRDMHGPGWRFQLTQFSSACVQVQHADAAAVVDRYLDAWSQPASADRQRLLESSTVEGVLFRDRFGMCSTRAELEAHVGAVQRHMPGHVHTRSGAVMLCHGEALVRVVTRNAEGKTVGHGALALQLDPGGRLASITGFTEPGPT